MTMARPPSTYEGRTKNRESDFLCGFNRFFNRGNHRPGSLRNIQFIEQFAKALAVFGKINRFGSGTNNVYARSF